MNKINAHKNAPSKLNRFTTLPILLDILDRKSIYFPDYSSWEDKNDVAMMDLYKKHKLGSGKTNIRAMCFGWDDETIHHWKYFADGSAGCCIEFDADLLLSSLKKFNDDIVHGKIKYYKIKDIPQALEIDEIPFTKRHPYRIENEYRIIYTGDAGEFQLPIKMHWINKITFSQTMPKPVLDTIRSFISDKTNIETSNHSTVFKNTKFINTVKANLAI